MLYMLCRDRHLQFFLSQPQSKKKFSLQVVPLAVDAVLEEVGIEGVPVAVRAEELEVGFADVDVVGRRVVVQLLVPLLQKQPHVKRLW